MGECYVSWRNFPKNSSLNREFFVSLGVCVFGFPGSQRAGDIRAEPRWLAFSASGQCLVTCFRTRATGHSVNILLGKSRKPANSVLPGGQATSPSPGVSWDKFLQIEDLPYARAMIIVHLKLQYSTLKTDVSYGIALNILKSTAMEIHLMLSKVNCVG